MAAEAAVGKAVETGAKRALGGGVSRTSALFTSAVVGVGAAVLTYKLLRSGDDE